TIKGHQLFAVVTPRVMIAKEDGIFLGTIPPIPAPSGFGASEEQSTPAPKKAAPQASPKENAIQYRLKQPISFNFKEVPLQQAIKDLAVLSGIQIVPDQLAFKEARVDLNVPISGNVQNVNMSYALNIVFNPLGFRYVIE